MARFHTSHGEFVGVSKLPNLVTSLVQAVIRKTTGHIPRKPWIPFSAAHALANLIQPGWMGWEIGSGFSTLWLSDKLKGLISIEADRNWFDRLSSIIQKEAIKNIDLRYESNSPFGSDTYIHPMI